MTTHEWLGDADDRVRDGVACGDVKDAAGERSLMRDARGDVRHGQRRDHVAAAAHGIARVREPFERRRTVLHRSELQSLIGQRGAEQHGACGCPECWVPGAKLDLAASGRHAQQHRR